MTQHTTVEQHAALVLLGWTLDDEGDYEREEDAKLHWLVCDAGRRWSTLLSEEDIDKGGYYDDPVALALEVQRHMTT